MGQPIVHQNALYELLRAEKVHEFNEKIATTQASDVQLNSGDYRGLDLRELNVNGLDFSDAYFRGADLRGIDFRNCNIEGASFCQAHISGCYFPDTLSADEIRLSFDLGTRVRYRK